ncbi:MAG: adenine phosphoribosyltransferase [Planctomycetota bacterium]|nr:MAG: adenine phosphoribosyltransferase [Planctomycetota bacterium]
MDSLKRLIRDIPDFPVKGIIFKDITPLLRDAEALRSATDAIAEHFRDRGVTCVCGMEARGFIFGTAIAYALGVGFVPLRKPGKLPYETESVSYQLEYGTATLEIHKDAVGPNDRVLMVDDLLATGGTMAASCRLVQKLGARVEACAFVVELTFLGGRDKLDAEVVSLIRY